MRGKETAKHYMLPFVMMFYMKTYLIPDILIINKNSSF